MLTCGNGEAGVDHARGEPVRDRVALVTGGGGGTARNRARTGPVRRPGGGGRPGHGVTGEPLGEATAAATSRWTEESGGTAMAATVSVAELDAVRALFDEFVTHS